MKKHTKPETTDIMTAVAIPPGMLAKELGAVEAILRLAEKGNPEEGCIVAAAKLRELAETIKKSTVQLDQKCYSCEESPAAICRDCAATHEK